MKLYRLVLSILHHLLSSCSLLFVRLLRFSREAAQVLSPFSFFLPSPSSPTSPFLLFSLTFLTSVQPVSQVHRLTSHWVHILLVLDPLCVVIVYSLMTARYAYLSTRVLPPRVVVYHVLSTEILKTPFEPHLFPAPSRTGPSKSF